MSRHSRHFTIWLQAHNHRTFISWKLIFMFMVFCCCLSTNYMGERAVARWMSTINSVLWLSKTDTLIVFYWMGNNVFRCCQWLVREFMGDRCWLLLIHWSGSFLRGERTNAMCHELLLLIASFFLFFDSHSVIFRWSMALALEKYLIAVQCWEYMNEWWLPFDHILQHQARDKCITDIYLIFQFIFVQETAQPS